MERHGQGPAMMPRRRAAASDDPVAVRQAQLSALRMAEAQVAARRHQSSSSWAVPRAQEVNKPGKEPPSPGAASTASVATEDGSQAEWSASSHSQLSHLTSSSSPGWSLQPGDAARWKAEIAETTARLVAARLAAVQMRQDAAALSAAEASEARMNAQDELSGLHTVCQEQPSQQPRQGAAWEAACLEAMSVINGTAMSASAFRSAPSSGGTLAEPAQQDTHRLATWPEGLASSGCDVHLSGGPEVCQAAFLASLPSGGYVASSEAALHCIAERRAGSTGMAAPQAVEHRTACSPAQGVASPPLQRSLVQVGQGKNFSEMLDQQRAAQQAMKMRLLSHS